MLFKQIICGGTFDKLHEGHKAFLHFAFTMGEHVRIGLTSDMYVTKIKKEKVSPFAQRKKTLEVFLKNEHFLSRSLIVKIESKFGETQIQNSKDTALLVSYETYPVGLEINDERRKNNLEPFDLLLFPLVQSSISGKLSSRDIRQGVINAEGMLIPEKIFTSKTVTLSEVLRRKLQKPYGTLFANGVSEEYRKDPKKIVTVGDATTQYFHSLGIRQQLSVVDFLIERKPTHQNLQDLGFLGNENIVRVKNSQGKIEKQVWSIFQKTIEHLAEKETIIVVDGEDDLLVIPLILLLPIGFSLFYGQPALPIAQRLASTQARGESKQGVVLVEITEQVKYETYRLLKQFDHS